MELPTALLRCLCGDSHDQPTAHPQQPAYILVTEKPRPEPCLLSHELLNDVDDVNKNVIKLLTILLQSPVPPTGTDLTPLLATEVSTASWTSYLAERLLRALEDTLRTSDRSGWGAALRDAYDGAVEVAKRELGALWEYAQAHPYEVAASVLLTVLALGVLGRLAPAFVRVLGFGRLGPVEGSFAAWWQRLYAGYVPKGSLWSFLQRMGMTWE